MRLDPERRRKLAELADARASTVSDAVRALIDEAYEAIQRERRREGVRRIAALRIEHMPDPDELNRQLNDKYGPLP